MPGRRNAVIAAAALVLSIALPGLAGADDGALVFDLATPTDQHDARISWHLLGNNIVHPSVTKAWYSGYLGDPGVLKGEVTADLDEGTLSGGFTETWSAGGSYADWTLLDLTMTATIVEGVVVAADGGWNVSGKVQLTYRGKGSYPESPSICGTEECYICKQQVCTFDRTLAGEARFSGRIEGTTLSIGFSDGLKKKIEEVDVSGMQDREYFLSLFSATVPGGVPPGTGAETVVPEPVGTGPEAVPAAGGDPIESAESGVSETATEPAEPVPAEAGAEPESSQEAQEPPPASSSSTGKRWSSRVWLVLLLGVSGGAVGVWIAIKGVLMLRGGEVNPLLSKPKEFARSIEKAWNKGVTDPEPTFIEYPEDVAEEQERRFEESMSSTLAPPPQEPPPPQQAPAPPPVEPPAPPPPPPFEPTHEIVLGEQVEHGRVPGAHVGGEAVTLLDAGTPVQVISEDGEYVTVSRGDGPPMRIHNSGVRPKSG